MRILRQAAGQKGQRKAGTWTSGQPTAETFEIRGGLDNLNQTEAAHELISKQVVQCRVDLIFVLLSLGVSVSVENPKSLSALVNFNDGAIVRKGAQWTFHSFSELHAWRRL